MGDKEKIGFILWNKTMDFEADFMTKSFFLSILLLVVIEEIMEMIYKRSKQYKDSLGGAASFKKVPFELEIVNIGSGQGLYGISYESCELNGFNFSTAPQNYKNGIKILHKFSRHMAEKCIVIILVLPMSFGKNKEYNKADYMDKFYGILPYREIEGFSLKRALILYHPFLRKMLKKVQRHLMGKNFLQKRPVIEDSNTKMSMQEINIEEQIPDIINTWIKEFQLTDLYDVSQVMNHADSFQEKTAILSDGIKYCITNSWRPVFVISPVPPNTRSYIGEEFLEAFVYRNLSDLQKQFPNIPLLDYYADERFEQECFENDIFLNEKGRKMFSEILFQDVKKRYD